MGVTKQSGDWSSNADTTTLAHTVNAGSNRCLIVCIGTEGSSATTGSVDYGGEAMTEIREESAVGGASAHTSMWYLLEVDIAAAGTNVITPTFDSAPSSYAIIAGAFDGVDQTGVSGTTFPVIDGDNSTTSTPNPFTTMDITGSVDNAIVSCSSNGGTGTSSWHAHLTERADVAATSSVFTAADAIIPNTNPQQVECTFSSQTRRADVTVEINAAALGRTMSVIIT